MSPPTRVSRDAERTRRAILDAAGDLFAAEGYEAVSLRAIGAKAGVNAALVCRYFGTKDALFIAVLRAGYEEWKSARGDAAHFYEHIVSAWLAGGGSDEAFRNLRIILQSAGSRRAGTLLHRIYGAETFRDLELWLGGRGSEARARIFIGLMVGLAYTHRYCADAPFQPCEGAANRYFAPAVARVLPHP